MPPQREPANIGVAHGSWGEQIAVEYLRIRGYVIVDRNTHPCRHDRRLEIDIVAYDRKNDVMVFVEVKQHKSRSDYATRLRSIDRRKKRLLRTACQAWMRRNKWAGARRFDVIEVYGSPEGGGSAEIDHIERVRLFEVEDRFVNWSD